MKPRYDLKKGILCILSSAFFFSAMSMFVKLSGNLPVMQKSLFRNSVALVIASIAILKEGNGLEIKPGTFKFYMGRAMCGTVGVICNFYAIDHLVLSDASMLNKMSPFFAMLFSRILLKDKVSRRQAFAVIIAFTGALFVIKPSFRNVLILPYCVGFLGGLCAGAAYTFVRRLSFEGAKTSTIVFIFSAVTTIVALPFTVINYVSMSLNQLLFLLLAGCCGAGGQFSITAAYSYAPAKEISIFDYTQVIFAALWGFFLFGQIPDAWSFAGYAIICSAAILNFRNRKKKESLE